MIAMVLLLLALCFGDVWEVFVEIDELVQSFRGAESSRSLRASLDCPKQPAIRTAPITSTSTCCDDIARHRGWRAGF